MHCADESLMNLFHQFSFYLLLNFAPYVGRPTYCAWQKEHTIGTNHGVTDRNWPGHTNLHLLLQMPVPRTVRFDRAIMVLLGTQA